MTRTLIGTAAGALALGSLVTVQALKAPSTDASRMARTFESRSDASTGPVLVNCGEGFRALVRPVGMGGQQVSQVDCVAAAPTLPVTVDAWGQPVAYATPGGPMLASYTTASRPIARTATQTVYRERPATYRTSTVTRRQPTTQVRSWKKSALIIGGSAAGGAAVGAVLDGKSGAKKGAVVGGVAGTVYDIATRSKTRY